MAWATRPRTCPIMPAAVSRAVRSAAPSDRIPPRMTPASAIDRPRREWLRIPTHYLHPMYPILIYLYTFDFTP